MGKERDGSDERDGGETVGNSLGRAPFGRSGMEGTTGWRRAALRRSGDKVDGWETVGNSLGRARVFRTNSINAIPPKNCAPRTFQVVCNRDMHIFVGRERH